MTEGTHVGSQNESSSEDKKVDGWKVPKSEKEFSRYKPESRPWKCRICDVDFTHFKFWVNHQLAQHQPDEKEKPMVVYWINKQERSMTPQNLKNRQPPSTDDDDAGSTSGDSICDASTEVSSKEEEEEEGDETDEVDDDKTSTSSSFQCSKCQNVYAFKSSLRTHENMCHDKTKTFQCGLCQESFLTNQQRYRHQNRNHPGKFKSRRRIVFGKQRRPQSTNNNGHTSAVKKVSEQGTHKCRMCPKRFNQLMGLKIHIVRVHKYNKNPSQVINGQQSNNNDGKGQATVDKKNSFKCAMCVRRLPTLVGLKLHIIHCHKKPAERQHPTMDVLRPFKCSTCLNTYTAKCSLKYHMEHIHGKSLEEEAAAVTSKSSSTTTNRGGGSRFQMQKNLESKQKVGGAQEKNHSAAATNLKKSSSSSSICITSTVVNGRSQHRCNICSRAFRRRSQGIIHSRIHVSHRNRFKCSSCEKTYAWPVGLTKHQKTTGH